MKRTTETPSRLCSVASARDSALRTLSKDGADDKQQQQRLRSLQDTLTASMTDSAASDDPCVSSDSSNSNSNGNGNSNGWLNGIGSDFRSLATSIKSTVPQAIGDFADFVHQSAVHVAAEIAELEREQEQQANSSAWSRTDRSPSRTNIVVGGSEECRTIDDRASDEDDDDDDRSLPLPWEVKHRVRSCNSNNSNSNSSSSNCQYHHHKGDDDGESVYPTDQHLMDVILDLSHHEHNFTQPYTADLHHSVPPITPQLSELIARIVDVDEKLKHLLGRLSKQDDFHEAAFWHNYLFRCEQVREAYLRGDNLKHDRSVAMNQTAPTTNAGTIARQQPADKHFPSVSSPTRKASKSTGSQPTPAASNTAGSSETTARKATPATTPKKNAAIVAATPNTNTSQVQSTAASRANHIGTVVDFDPSALARNVRSTDSNNSKNVTHGSARKAAPDAAPDDSSLVPASLPDDSSYVIPSAPPSTMSVDDMVVISEHR